MPLYEQGDDRIHYKDAGTGLPLLVIPGGGLNSTIAGLATHSFNPFDKCTGECRVIGRVPVGCGQCFETFPDPSVSCESGGHQHTQRVFNPSARPLGRYMSARPLLTCTIIKSAVS